MSNTNPGTGANSAPSVPSVRRIELNYAGVQGSFQFAYCAICGFTTIYLTWRGLSDTQIGLTSSLTAIASILLQLILGDWCDRRTGARVKQVIIGLYVFTIALAGSVHFLPLSAAAMMAAFALAQGSTSATDCFNSAMMMQFVNAGFPVRYGWTRSVGSVTYAVLAFFLGDIIEANSPELVLPVYIGFALLGIVIVAMMPVPQGGRQAAAEKTKHVGYLTMLRRSLPLTLLLAAVILYTTGSNPSYTFLIRIIERLGGDSGTLGKTLFLQAVLELPTLCLSPRWSKRLPLSVLICIAVGVRFARIIGLMCARSMTAFFLVSAFGGLGNGLYMGTSVVFVNSIVHDGEHVRAQSLLGFSNTIGSIVGNALSGLILDSLGLDTLLGTGSVLCLAGLGVLICCGLAARRAKAEEK